MGGAAKKEPVDTGLPLEEVKRLSWQEQVAYFESEIKKGPMGYAKHKAFVELLSYPSLGDHRQTAEKEQLKRVEARRNGYVSNQKNQNLGCYQRNWMKYEPER